MVAGAAGSFSGEDTNAWFGLVPAGVVASPERFKVAAFQGEKHGTLFRSEKRGVGCLKNVWNVHSVMRRLPPLIHAGLASAGLLAALVFLVSRVLTDRVLLTQYAYWVPSMVFVAVVGGLGLGALVFGAVRLSVLSRDERRRCRVSRRLTRGSLIGAALIVLHMVLIEWRSWRYVFPAAPADPERTLVVLHWNMTYVEPGQWDAFLDAMPLDPLPDVVVLTNPIWSNELKTLATRLGPGYRAIRIGSFGVASRFAMSGTRAERLGISSSAATGGLFASPANHDKTESELLPSWSPISRVGGSTHDPGHLVVAELDTTAVLGRPVVIWGIDMPSDVRLGRYRAAREAAATIEGLMHPARVEASGGDAEEGRGPGLLAEPDLIVGDFNIPRGSASLGLLTRGYPHAFSQAGRGYMASWPRQRRGPLGQRIPNAAPIFHLDHAFVSPWLRAATYELLDPGIAEHYVQRIRVTPRAR